MLFYKNILLHFFLIEYYIKIRDARDKMHKTNRKKIHIQKFSPFFCDGLQKKNEEGKGRYVSIQTR
jgi:hypothetical protein